VASDCLGEKKTLSQLLLNKCVSSFCHRSFWGVFTSRPNNFFHQCANMAWTTKGTKSLPLLGVSPLSLVDMLHVTSGGFGS